MYKTPFDPRGASPEAISTSIQDWLAQYVGDLLSLPADQVPVDTPFDRYGLDSAAAVGMIGDLGDWMGKTLDPSLPYDYPTAQQLANYLASVAADGPIGQDAAAASTA